MPSRQVFKRVASEADSVGCCGMRSMPERSKDTKGWGDKVVPRSCGYLS